MNLFGFDVQSLMQYTIVLMRVSALVYTIPVIGSSSAPQQMKLGLAALASACIYAATDMPTIDLSMPFWKYAGFLAGEVAVGLIIGFATQLVFTAVQLAGHIIGFQMGFAIVNVMDPATQSQVSITAQFQNIIALLIFLGINGHHYLIMAGAKSFELIPVLGFNPSPGLVEMMVALTKGVFITAIKLGGPIMATLFFLNVGLGLVARTVPQMNVFIVGFPVQIALGLFMIGVTAPMFNTGFQSALGAMIGNLSSLMRLM